MFEVDMGATVQSHSFMNAIDSTAQITLKALVRTFRLAIARVVRDNLHPDHHECFKSVVVTQSVLNSIACR
eukprot:1413465-Alexandrium_andersonii.AAC.1